MQAGRSSPIGSEPANGAELASASLPVFEPTVSASRVQTLLETIDDGNSVDGDPIEKRLLRSEGLISVISREEFLDNTLIAEGLQDCKKECAAATSRLAKQEAEVVRLEKAEQSTLGWIGRELGIIGGPSLKQAREALDKERGDHYEASANLDAAKDAIRTNHARVLWDDDYVRLTDNGELIMRRLSALDSETSLRSYLGVAREARSLLVASAARIERFLDFRAGMEHAGFSSADPRVVDCALALSQCKGGRQEIIERACAINEHLNANAWSSLERLRCTAIHTGSTARPPEALSSVFKALVEIGQPRDYATWCNAALLAGVSGETDPIGRFQRAEEELCRRRVFPAGPETSLAAARIAAQCADPAAAADRIAELRKLLRAQRLADGPEVSLAALELSLCEASPKAISIRFNMSSKALTTWQISLSRKEDYLASAFVALLPGPPGRNAQLVGEIATRLRASGLPPFASALRATGVLGAALSDVSPGHTAEAFQDGLQGHFLRIALGLFGGPGRLASSTGSALTALDVSPLTDVSELDLGEADRQPCPLGIAELSH